MLTRGAPNRAMIMGTISRAVAISRDLDVVKLKNYEAWTFYILEIVNLRKWRFLILGGSCLQKNTYELGLEFYLSFQTMNSYDRGDE